MIRTLLVRGGLLAVAACLVAPLAACTSSGDATTAATSSASPSGTAATSAASSTSAAAGTNEPVGAGCPQLPAAGPPGRGRRPGGDRRELGPAAGLAGAGA